MDSTIFATPPSTNTPPAAVPNKSRCSITVDAIFIERARLFAYSHCANRSYFHELKAKTLVEFSAFSEFFQRAEGIDITHQSQQAPTPRRRHYDWQVALREAFDRGGIL